MPHPTRTLALLDRLVAFPTVSRDSNLDLIDWAEALLSGCGFEVTRIWSPARDKAGLFARIGPRIDGGICLSGHTDVVPVEGQNWTRPAFKLTQEGGRVFGRGATDMKGFLASALAMAEHAQSRCLKAPLSLVLSYDEEIGCVGLREMLPELKPLIARPDVVIVGEPTAMQIAIGHKGKSALDITCHGQAGHSALAPQFVNAIHVASHFVTELQALQARLAEGVKDDAYDIPYSTIHVGQISGGQALNIVPDLVTLTMEFRHLADASPGDILAEINAAATRSTQAFAPDGAVTIKQRTSYPGLCVAPDAPAIDWARKITQGGETTKVAFGTEAGFFAELGLNTLVIGPGDMARDGHKADEGLDLAQLDQCDAMMTRVLQDLTG